MEQNAIVRYKYALLFFIFLRLSYWPERTLRRGGICQSSPIRSTSRSHSGGGAGLLCLTGSAGLLCLAGSPAQSCPIGSIVLLRLTGSSIRLCLTGSDALPRLAGPSSQRSLSGYKSTIATFPCLLLLLFFRGPDCGSSISHNAISLFLFGTLPCTIFPTLCG